MIGLAPFERSLADGTGARLFTASADGGQGEVCPFCHRAMRRLPDGCAGPPGMAVCRLCEQVWLPADAADWLASHAAHAAGPPSAPAPPGHCEDCGAPWAPDPEGRCRYCHAQLTAPAPAVVVMTEPGRRGERVTDLIAGLLDG
jgi:hypothetical protein